MTNRGKSQWHQTPASVMARRTTSRAHGPIVDPHAPWWRRIWGR